MTKIDKRRRYYIILDTETANSVEQPLPYDIGWVVCDKHGNIYAERSFIVDEVFYDMADLMQTAYYANKLPQYFEDIRKGDRVVASMWAIRRALKEDMEVYNTNEIGAYNMRFDRNALNNLIRYISKSWMRWFLPYGVELFDIWNPTCELLLARPSYIRFAEKHGFISEAGNIQTSAECAYRYITKDTEFIESHTGLEDCKIEAALFAKCKSQHKPMNTKIEPWCWRKVQKKRKEIKERA